MRVMRALSCFLIACLWIPVTALAGEVAIESVVIVPSNAGGYNIQVTIRHDDAGWDHFADKWQVLSPDGKMILAERVLFHPHVDEQPVTRGLRAVLIPPYMKRVMIRAHAKPHGWSEQLFMADVPDR